MTRLLTYLDSFVDYRKLIPWLLILAGLGWFWGWVLL